ncbi:MAG: AAA family ATPase [Candidatus Methanomethylophilaceae archaeon]|jgi:predicted cytidylate kinase|nr:AAA family ATPase [Candidatus Methanomethylophilaceae archaeon]NLF33827.1 AAA family ATPase [Thermoplasmatales archaeon]
MRITISGPPGSGKTTTCKLLSESLGLEAVVFGNLFRELARERGLTVAELGELAEKDPSIDRAIDDRILEIARENEDIILESRLSAHMLEKDCIPCFKVRLEASPDVRVSRVGLREDQTKEEAERETAERQACEARRYKKYYGIDINDKSVYDIVVKTDDLTPEEVLQKVLEAVEGRNC